MACGITMGAVVDCGDPLAPRVRQRVIIGNTDDIATVTYGANDSLITDITMKTGTQCWAFGGKKTSISASSELNPTDFAVYYNHIVNLIVWDTSSDQKQNLQGMAEGNLFCIIENANDSSHGDSVFEVFCLERGGEVTQNTRLNGGDDAGGGYSLIISTPEAGGGEVQLPKSWNDTDYATTLAKVEALLQVQA